MCDCEQIIHASCFIQIAKSHVFFSFRNNCILLHVLIKLLDVAEDTTATYDGLVLGGSAPTKNLAGGSKMVDPFKDNGGAGGQELGQVLDHGGEVEKKGSSLSELFFGDTPTITKKNNYVQTKFGSTGFGIDGIVGVDGEENGMIIEQEQDGTLETGAGGLKDELTLKTVGDGKESLMDRPTANGVGAGDGASSEMMGGEATKESETFRGVGAGSQKVAKGFREGTMVVSRISVALLCVVLISVKWLFHYSLTHFSTFISTSGTGQTIR